MKCEICGSEPPAGERGHVVAYKLHPLPPIQEYMALTDEQHRAYNGRTVFTCGEASCVARAKEHGAP